jgi:hypothetical protein
MLGSLVLDLSVGDVECRAILLCMSFNVICKQCIHNAFLHYIWTLFDLYVKYVVAHVVYDGISRNYKPYINKTLTMLSNWSEILSIIIKILG